MTERRTPLNKAKGAGSAKSGLHHWMLLNLTSLALIPLTIWFAFMMVDLSKLTWDMQKLWLADPINSFLMILFIAISMIHSGNGFQVILEDYVHAKFVKFMCIILFKAVTYIAGLAAILAILFLLFKH